jgi:hypothetical protein
LTPKDKQASRLGVVVMLELKLGEGGMASNGAVERWRPAPRATDGCTSLGYAAILKFGGK